MERLEYQVIKHCLGVKTEMPAEFQQNRFIAGDDHADMPVLLSLLEKGYMTCSGPKNILAGDRIWRVTQEGIEKFKEIYHGFGKA